MKCRTHTSFFIFSHFSNDCVYLLESSRSDPWVFLSSILKPVVGHGEFPPGGSVMSWQSSSLLHEMRKYLFPVSLYLSCPWPGLSFFSELFRTSNALSFGEGVDVFVFKSLFSTHLTFSEEEASSLLRRTVLVGSGAHHWACGWAWTCRVTDSPGYNDVFRVHCETRLVNYGEITPSSR